MTADQMLEALRKYDLLLARMGVPIAEHPNDAPCRTKAADLANTRWLIDRAIKDICGGHMEKADIWFGWIQHSLWRNSVITMSNVYGDRYETILLPWTTGHGDAVPTGEKTEVPAAAEETPTAPAAPDLSSYFRCTRPNRRSDAIIY